MLRKIIVFLVYIFNVIVFRVKCVGQENIQNKGAYIICANHTPKDVLIFFKVSVSKSNSATTGAEFILSKKSGGTL